MVGWNSVANSSNDFFLFSADVPHLGVYDGAKYDLGGRNGWARFGGRETGTTEDFAFSQ